jgi:hypothetical protein
VHKNSSYWFGVDVHIQYLRSQRVPGENSVMLFFGIEMSDSYVYNRNILC